MSDQNPLRPESVAERLENLWSHGERPDVDVFLAAAGPLTPLAKAALLRVDQRRRWEAGERVEAEGYLRRHPEIRADPESALDLIHGEFLLRERHGERPSCEDFVRRFPEYADVLKAQIDLHLALASSAEGASLDQPTVYIVPPAAIARGWPAPVGYELLGELGRGGMGVVYRARHLELDRVVALKVLRSGVHADSDELARFRAEAEAVARLQHPNVVQIFEIGEADGQPFLALEYVGGGSLDRQWAGKPQPARAAAQLLETLARAVHVAHDAGIVHRDLKPANVLLANGVAKVADFGLARRLDEGTGHTPSGAIVGTPSYMAPEQAAGKTSDLGPPADIYSLGAILYEALTGRPPFLGATPLDTLQQVLADEPVPPRRLQPKVPRDLETICLKCLHKEPQRRYGSAADLADDLRRFVAGEPIRARPVGAPARLARWCRRKPTVAALSAAVVVAGVLGVGGVTHQWLTARRERDRAEEGFRMARKAVDDCFTRAAEDPRLQGPPMQQVRQLLFESTLPYYESFLVRYGDDVALKEEAARTHVKVGIITSAIGRKEDARAAFARAGNLWRALGARRFPRDLAVSLRLLGMVQWRTGRRDDALNSFEEARTLLEDGHADAPDDAALHLDLARVYDALGVLHHDTGRRPEALAAYEQARTAQEEMAHSPSATADMRRHAASTCSNLGILLYELGRKDDALRLFGQARELLETLTSQDRSDVVAASALAQVLTYTANLHGEAGRPAESLLLHEKARAIAAQLVAAHPQVGDYRDTLAGIRMNAGLVQEKQRRYDEALAAYEDARALRETLVRDDPRDLRLQTNLALNLYNIGLLQSARDRPEEALAAHRKAHSLNRDLVRLDPQDREFLYDLARGDLEIGLLEERLGQRAKALRSLEASRDAFARLTDGGYQRPKLSTLLGRARAAVAELQNRPGR